MSKQARAEQVIHRPVDVVWARIGNFGDVSWVPNTDTQRTLSYELAKEFDLSVIFGPGHMVTTINGTLLVVPQGPDASLVTYDVETDDFMIEGTHAEYQGSLDNLKQLLEN